MIRITSTGDFKNAEKFLNRLKSDEIFSALDAGGAAGQAALAAATPADSGLAQGSWSYTVISKRGYHSIVWRNSDIENGFPVAVMIQLGHGTGTGGYIQGRDYINPAIQPVFDKILADVMKEVNK